MLAGVQTVADSKNDEVARPKIEVHPTRRHAEPVTRFDERGPVAHPDAGRPQVLSVPRLNIEAPVLRIEVEDGVLTPPANASTVGWDVQTADTGAAYGSSVITGHTVHTGGGALNELDDLRLGDTVFITTAEGRIRYDVTEVFERTKEQMVDTLPRLYRGDVAGRLVLITCTDWNGSGYDANTVVVAQPA